MSTCAEQRNRTAAHVGPYPDMRSRGRCGCVCCGGAAPPSWKAKEEEEVGPDVIVTTRRQKQTGLI